MQNIKEFLTIRKKIYNFFLEKTTEKVFRFYNRNFLPPTIGYTINPNSCEILQPIEKTLNFKLKEISEELKEKFKENIIIQDQVLSMIKKRNEEFNYRCGIVKLETGKGKTFIIRDIINYYQTNTLIFVHNLKTMSEMKNFIIENTNIIPCVYGGGKKEVGKITIITREGFYQNFKEIENNFNLIIFDELHEKFTKKLWEAINISFNNRKGIALYGLSATPKRQLLDTCDLEKYFGRIIEVKRDAYRYDIKPNFIFIDYYYNGFYRYENPAEMRTAVSENIERFNEQIKIVENIGNSNRKCLLILTDRISELKNIEKKLLELNNFDYVFSMSGETKIIDDENYIKKSGEYIKLGKKVCIIGSIQKCGTGVNIQFIDSVFLISSIKIESRVIQSIGRALRKYEDKQTSDIYIFNDLPIYKNQRIDKLKTVLSEYELKKDEIKIIQIGK